MKEPKVELKNVRTFAGHDGTGLNADVWINGINCMHVFDGAYGGEFEYTENTFNNPKAEQVKANIQLLDDYIAQMPEQDTPYGKIKFNRDCYIDEVLNRQEKAKGLKKMKAMYNHAVVVGVPNGNSYRYFDFKRPLSGLPTPYLQTQVNIIKTKCTGGEVILNDNLSALSIVV